MKATLLLLALLAGAPVCAPLPGALRAQVVVIDPGHGGEDPGAIGPGGAREKDVALAVALALARELARYPEMEVHLTRDRDVLVPLWERGKRATDLKGERAGIFISIHANALPTPSAVRGFETFFLSEARTDDERRVAANENAPLALGGGGAAGGAEAGVDFILRELRSVGYQPWSALLAELVQERFRPVHPGPDRGVKQGPLAVITNAMMPAVLVEVGFITHPEEERLLGRPEFHQAAASALADAVLAFFRRYPPSEGRAAVPALGVERPGAARTPFGGPVGRRAQGPGEGCIIRHPAHGEAGTGRVAFAGVDAPREHPCLR